MNIQKSLIKEVFDTPAFKLYAEFHYVLLFVDSPQSHKQSEKLKAHNKRLKQFFQVTGYPRIILADSDFKKLTVAGYIEGDTLEFTNTLRKNAKELSDESRLELIKALELELGVKMPKKHSQNTQVSSGWISDFEEAKRRAKKEKKEILAYFAGSDWCGWCIKLHKKTTGTNDFIKSASEKYILLYLDTPLKGYQSKELKESVKKLVGSYEINAFPTLLVLDANGNEAARTRYKDLSSNDYIKHLNSLPRIKWQ